MVEKPAIDGLDLSDAELLELIKKHGTARRSVLKVLGVGTAVSLGAGSAAGNHHDPHPPTIDPYYGYAAPEDEPLHGDRCPDHAVRLLFDPSAFSPERQTDLPFVFEPMGLHVEAGDVVRFDFDTPEHTVTAYHPGQGRQQRVPDDVPPFSSPVMNAGGFWLYEFHSPGLYDLFCAPHEPFGMVMRVVVGDPDGGEYDGSFGSQGRPPVSREELNDVGVTTWPYPTPEEVFETAALDESNIVDAGSVSAAEVETEL